MSTITGISSLYLVQNPKFLTFRTILKNICITAMSTDSKNLAEKQPRSLPLRDYGPNRKINQDSQAQRKLLTGSAVLLEDFRALLELWLFW
jgi:hypothetical protein